MECSVCISPFNKTTRSCVECPRCLYKACQSCVRTYLLGSHLDSHCMNCKQPWDRMFLANNLPSSFLTKEWKQHRADVLFERERSLFPDTMEHIRRDRRVEELRREILELQHRKDAIKVRINQIQTEIWRVNHPQSSQTPKAKSLFLRPCSAEDCRGYIDENSGICGICDKTTCIRCNIIVTGEDHACRDEDKENWEHIRKNTKPCPQCHVRIHKISGCYQMWCPQCHTAFNYNTGEIEKGTIHNPHYYDYLRMNPQAAVRIQQGPCGAANRLPEAYSINRIKSPHRDAWMSFHRLLNHIRHVELRRWEDDRGEASLELRKKFMLNEMDEPIFKRRIQEREKRNHRKTEIRKILEMVVTVGREMLIEYTHNHRESLFQEMTNLLQYTNESIKLVNKNYQCNFRLINTSNFTFE